MKKSDYIGRNGLYYLWAPQKQRPCLFPVKGASGALGVLVFTTESAAESYRRKIKAKKFPVRHVPPGDLIDWLKDRRREASYLAYPLLGNRYDYLPLLNFTAGLEKLMQQERDFFGNRSAELPDGNHWHRGSLGR